MDDELNGKRVTVAGLGHFGGGITVARWLVEQGAIVTVTDSAPAEKLSDSIAQLDQLPVKFHLGGHQREDFTNTDLVVASPAIPLSNEFLCAARDARMPITTEIKLFIERCAAPIVGITGTKGKSTTTALLSRMLERRFKVWTGGNIGVSLIPDLPRIEPAHLVVLELSSFMLEHLGAMRWSPHVAAITMIGVDHLSWHGSVEAYLNAKRNIVRFQNREDIAVVTDDDRDFSKLTPAKIARYGLRERKNFSLQIPGEHNQLNAQAAFATANALGVSWDEAQAAVRDFAGLPHRMQLIHTDARGVRWFNDSIATIPQSAIVALKSFSDRRVIQIVGGSDKRLDLSEMCEALSRRAKAVLTIGAIGSSVCLHIHGPRVEHCGELPAAVARARELASEGDIVLLSPGTASYDQFANFQKRGEEFTRLARAN